MLVVRCRLRYCRAHDNAGVRIGGQLHVVTEAIVLADTLLHDASLWVGDRLISNKGTQSPIEFWPSAYAQRIFGYSAAPSMGPNLVSPIWGLIAEELRSEE